jgi:hypothetical protein
LIHAGAIEVHLVSVVFSHREKKSSSRAASGRPSRRRLSRRLAGRDRLARPSRTPVAAFDDILGHRFARFKLLSRRRDFVKIKRPIAHRQPRSLATALSQGRAGPFSASLHSHFPFGFFIIAKRLQRCIAVLDYSARTAKDRLGMV